MSDGEVMVTFLAPITLSEQLFGVFLSSMMT